MYNIVCKILFFQIYVYVIQSKLQHFPYIIFPLKWLLLTDNNSDLDSLTGKTLAVLLSIKVKLFREWYYFSYFATHFFYEN